jgi:uncharacterized membrane protein HdeD (DUF308 family)
MSPIENGPSEWREGSETLAARWRWIVAVGAVLSLCGLIALGSVIAATVASVLFVGVMMIVAGTYEVIHAFAVKSWGRFALWALLGLVYSCAGIATVMNPLLGAGVFTLLIGAGLVASGLLRLVLAIELRDRPHWGWAAVSGCITTLLGGVILFQWPASSFYTLGIFMGLDLVFAGSSWLAIGFALRHAGPDGGRPLETGNSNV